MVSKKMIRRFFSEMESQGVAAFAPENPITVVDSINDDGEQETLQERWSLDRGFENPAGLWVQGLTEREYSRLLKILSKGYNGAITAKKLQKAFPDLEGPLYEEFEKLCISILVDKVPEKYLHWGPAFSGNFLSVGIDAHLDKSHFLAEGFDEIRDEEASEDLLLDH